MDKFFNVSPCRGQNMQDHVIRLHLDSLNSVNFFVSNHLRPSVEDPDGRLLRKLGVAKGIQLFAIIHCYISWEPNNGWVPLGLLRFYFFHPIKKFFVDDFEILDFNWLRIDRALLYLTYWGVGSPRVHKLKDKRAARAKHPYINVLSASSMQVELIPSGLKNMFDFLGNLTLDRSCRDRGIDPFYKPRSLRDISAQFLVPAID